MPNKIRVGRSAFFRFFVFFFLLPKETLWGKSEGKIRFATNKSLGSGPYLRDGRVTGNKHIFVLGLTLSHLIVHRRVDVKWGEFTVLEPELICLEELYKRKDSWRYFINLTGG